MLKEAGIKQIYVNDVKPTRDTPGLLQRLWKSLLLMLSAKGS